jgi:hypothetical protein
MIKTNSTVHSGAVRIAVFLLYAMTLTAGCSDDDTQTTNENTNQNTNQNTNENENCVPSDEIADNAVDEDCDGWLATSRGFEIRAAHPRVLIDPAGLTAAVARMTGPDARDPYRRWFELIQQSADDGQEMDPVNLALLYRATGQRTYLDRYVAGVAESGDPSFGELLALDLVFDAVDTEIKERIMGRVSANDDCWYYNSVAQSISGEANWGYHSAIGVARALAYAGVFALTPVELEKDPATFRFDALNYVALVDEELSEGGHFRRIENHIAGDPTHNTALPGERGGMYDNIGYDSAEESYSVNVLAEFYFLTGRDRHSGFYHDAYRSFFYQNMQYPHLYTAHTQDSWCRRAGTESHIMARIWNTQTDWISQPRTDAVALTAWLYEDGRMQYFKENGVQRELCGEPYDGMYWDLLFYRDDLAPIAPDQNPLAVYFSGPGLVVIREDWTNDAAFGVFIAGEGISRRYEDANSFLLHRKVDVIPHAGARIRNNDDNAKHHWYHIRSISKNTLKIFDPAECLDLDASSNRGPLHSGPALVDSDNMGGQLFETSISENDGDYTISNGGATPSRTHNPDHPLGLYEVADVIRYAHVDGDYTYAVGDGTAAYTRKIEYFEREFLYLRPDVFVLFDRVRTTDPTFRKVWTIHTVDEPTLDATVIAEDLGMHTHLDGRLVTIANPQNITTIDTLLPQANRVVVRGGDTMLVQDAPLDPTTPISSAQILESDIGRWLELFAVGDDTEGTVTISGDAREGTGVSEEIVFDGTLQTAVRSVPTADVNATQLTDETQHWQPDQWQNYQVNIRCGGDSETTVISGNDENTLFGTFTPCQTSWQYTIERPLANSYNHWIRIDSITTADMEVDFFTVSVPHYFDAEDASGRLASFAPHTDGRDDGYRKRKDLGQWTLEIEDTGSTLSTNFLNVFSLRDPAVGKPTVTLVESAHAAGAIIDTRFVVFAREPEPLSALTIEIPQAATLDGLVFDLLADATYYWVIEGDVLELSTTDNGGTAAATSAMGVLSINL